MSLPKRDEKSLIFANVMLSIPSKAGDSRSVTGKVNRTRLSDEFPSDFDSHDFRRVAQSDLDMLPQTFMAFINLF